MKLKLIQAGGFAGIRKMAEEDFSILGHDLQAKILKLFDEPATEEMAKTKIRDRENLFLQLKGDTIPLGNRNLDDDVAQVILRMKDNLRFQPH